ncbi:hypothetical protein Bbelb_082560 [Branchiostoma belcheri]|nr:hypothetical protein Bbelb_082560 [Branchiostoma belcheri]
MEGGALFVDFPALLTGTTRGPTFQQHSHRPELLRASRHQHPLSGSLEKEVVVFFATVRGRAKVFTEEEFILEKEAQQKKRDDAELKKEERRKQRESRKADEMAMAAQKREKQKKEKGVKQKKEKGVKENQCNTSEKGEDTLQILHVAELQDGGLVLGPYPATGVLRTCPAMENNQPFCRPARSPVSVELQLRAFAWDPLNPLRHKNSPPIDKIERAHPDGPKKKDGDGTRQHILFKLCSYRDKVNIMKLARTKLQDEPFYFTDDLTVTDLNEKRRWREKVSQAYEKGVRYRFYNGRWRDGRGQALNFD